MPTLNYNQSQILKMIGDYIMDKPCWCCLISGQNFLNAIRMSLFFLKKIKIANFPIGVNLVPLINAGQWCIFESMIIDIIYEEKMDLFFTDGYDIMYIQEID